MFFQKLTYELFINSLYLYYITFYNFCQEFQEFDKCASALKHSLYVIITTLLIASCLISPFINFIICSSVSAQKAHISEKLLKLFIWLLLNINLNILFYSFLWINFSYCAWYTISYKYNWDSCCYCHVNCSFLF